MHSLITDYSHNPKPKINMNLKTITWILFLFISTLSLVSCDKEKEDVLSINEIDGNTLKMHYGSKGGITILGGDGNYSFSCDSPLLKGEMTYKNYILFEPLGVGDATVTIKDQSGKSYILKVIISYETERITIAKLDATVIGDNMTVGAQKELKEKALATIPVKVGGSYKFVYTKLDNPEKFEGSIFIYPDKESNEVIEGTFAREIIKQEDGSYFYIAYHMHYKDSDRTFIQTIYNEPTSKSVQYRLYQFGEDLKEKFQSAYPNVEQVYTSQIIGEIKAE